MHIDNLVTYVCHLSFTHLFRCVLLGWYVMFHREHVKIISMYSIMTAGNLKCCQSALLNPS